jgi:hypothetical protein
VNKILGCLICVMFVIPLSGQGLFEAALKNEDESSSGNNSLGGFVRSAMYIGKTTDEKIPYLQSLYGQLGLTSDVDLGKYGAAFADVRFRFGNEFDSGVSQLEMREAYVDLFAGPLTLRTGKQIVSWGSSSFVNPSDQFSPLNPTVRSPDPDDMKIGVWSMNAKLTMGASSSLQILWMPLYQPSMLLTEPFTFPAYVAFTDPEWPTTELENSSYGFLYDLRTSVLDGSLSYYNGYRNNPKFSLESATFNPTTMAPEMIVMYQEPFRIQSAGLNLSVPVGAYIFRTEAAWMSPVDEAEENIYLPLSEVSYVGEIEQSGANTTLIAGYYGKYNLSFEAPTAEPAGLTGSFPDPTSLIPPGTPVTPELIDGIVSSQIDAFNRLYDYQMEEFYHSVYASVTINMLNDALKVEIPGMYNLTSKELMLMPSIEYSVTDGFIIKAGYTFMKGEENTLYNLVGPVLNAGFISFKVLY